LDRLRLGTQTGKYKCKYINVYTQVKESSSLLVVVSVAPPPLSAAAALSAAAPPLGVSAAAALALSAAAALLVAAALPVAAALLPVGPAVSQSERDIKINSLSTCCAVGERIETGAFTSWCVPPVLVPLPRGFGSLGPPEEAGCNSHTTVNHL